MAIVGGRNRRRILLGYDILGDGPDAVVLLHGFLGSGRNLRSLARRWHDRDPSLTLVLPDLTGHGESPPLPEAPTLEDLARDVLLLAHALKLGRPLRLVGHSLGGRVALAAAKLDPEAVSEVVLVDIAPGPVVLARRDPVLERLLAAPDRVPRREDAKRFLVDGGVPGPVADWLVMNLVHDDDRGDYAWRIDRAAMAELSRRTNAEDLWEVVEAGKLKVRLIRGGASAYTSDDDADRFRAAGVPVDTVRGAGHFVHVDAPDLLLDLLERR